MKALQQLSNREKGKLLAALFPEERQRILETIISCYTEWKAQETSVRSQWKHPIIHPNFWYAIAMRVHDTVLKDANGLTKSCLRFSDKLFEGYNALFTIDCIQKYVARGGGSKEFRMAVELLFPNDKQPIE